MSGALLTDQRLHSNICAGAAARLFEKINEMMIDTMQNSGKPAEENGQNGLYETNSDLRERGAENRLVLERSLYHQANLHPFVFGAAALGSGTAYRKKK